MRAADTPKGSRGRDPHGTGAGAAAIPEALPAPAELGIYGPQAGQDPSIGASPGFLSKSQQVTASMSCFLTGAELFGLIQAECHVWLDRQGTASLQLRANAPWHVVVHGVSQIGHHLSETTFGCSFICRWDCGKGLG